MRTFSAARQIARTAVFENARLNGRGEEINDSDRAIGVRIMSNLLWSVLAQDGGFCGLSDAGFDAFCERNKQTVSREIAMKAQYAPDVKWPAVPEEQADARNLAARAQEQFQEAAE